ncbi:MAG TPA: acetylxylan esterase [Chthonomonadaceae bacterium]|nr:acetylxylan esterase [Chthonomonadaceae bacterium]
MRSSGYRGLAATLFLLFAACSFTRAQSAPFTLPPPADTVDALRRSFYTYDRSLPLHADVKPLDSTADHTRYSLAYDSAHDQRVTAILSIPKRFAAPFPAVLLMHGSGGHKDADYIKSASFMLTAQGFATISVDAQYRGDRKRTDVTGELLNPDSFRMRDAWVQTVVDLRRAVDYLASRNDIDMSRVGYLGFSMGGMLGACLGGVEGRISCFLLAVPGGGLVKIAQELDKHPALKAYWPVTLTPEVMKRVEEFALVCDPIHFVGNILPRPLLIIVAKHDELIPPEASQMLIDAAHANEAINVKRMETSHVLAPAVIFDVRAFFIQHLGQRTPLAAAR